MKNQRDGGPSAQRKKENKEVARYMQLSGRGLKDIFIRKNFGWIITCIKFKLNIKGRITSWIQFAKMMIQLRHRFPEDPEQWKK